MLRVSGSSFLCAKYLKDLSNSIRGDREAFLQLLLSLCKKQTLNRIVDCPTYPLRIVTPDLEKKLDLIKHVIDSNSPFEISEILSALYESATEKHYRKGHGQYFTPFVIAEEAMKRLELKGEETVIDPGCGTGILAMAILRESASQSIDANTMTYVGVENDALLTLSAALALERIGAPKSWQVVYANFLLFTLKHLRNMGVSKVDAVIANPPFVRFHRLARRDRLKEKLGISKFSGLHSFFLAHSARSLRPSRMVFILPPEMYMTNYGSNLLGKLAQSYDFAKTEIYYDSRHHEYTFAQMPSNHVKDQLVGTIALFQSIAPAGGFDHAPYAQRSTGTPDMTLAFFARAHRGISTGANSFFVLTTESVENLGIPPVYLQKIVPPRTGRELLPVVFDEQDWEKLRSLDRPCWLLCLPRQTSPREMPPQVKQYIQTGERQGVHLTPTCSNRNPWYYIRIPPKIPELFFTYVSRRYPRFIYNKARVLNLTNLLGVYLKLTSNCFSNRMKELVELLNEDLRKCIDEGHAGRNYVGGLIKFEPKDLERLPISESVQKCLGITSLDTCLRKD